MEIIGKILTQTISGVIRSYTLPYQLTNIAESWSSYWSSLISATVEDALPTKVVLTFGEANTSLVASDFTIAGFTVSSLARDGTNKILTLTLSVAVVYGNSLTVVLNKEAGFSNAVTNNVLQIPVLQTVIVATATPTLVALTYNIALDTGSVPAAGAFAVIDHTISSVGISGAVVTLTLSTAVIYFDILTVNYTIGANPIRSAAGKNAATLVAQAITNNVAEDGNTVAQFDFLAASTITKDGANLVSRWNDKLLSGRDLLQAIGTNQPLWQSTGILFDGVDNFLKCAAFTFVQPEMIYFVGKLVTWTIYNNFFDGNTGNRGAIYQYDVTPGIVAYAGINSLQNNNLLINTFGIIRCLFNGANSSLQVNNTVAITGNFGTNNLGGFILGGRGDVSNFSNIEVKEIILRKTADDANVQISIYNYLKRKHSIVE